MSKIGQLRAAAASSLLCKNGELEEIDLAKSKTVGENHSSPPNQCRDPHFQLNVLRTGSSRLIRSTAGSTGSRSYQESAGLLLRLVDCPTTITAPQSGPLYTYSLRPILLA